MRRLRNLALGMLCAVQPLSAQVLRSFPLVNSHNKQAQAQLPWLETGDSVRNERINLRLWQQLLWGFEALENYWKDSSCQSLLFDLHDTLHGLQDANTVILWQNDSLITFETNAEWLGAYLSHSVHRTTVNARSGRIQYDAGADDALRKKIMADHGKAMMRRRNKILRTHLRDFRKISGNDRELLGIIRSECKEMAAQPEMWRDERGFCVRLDCALPHAFAAWDKEIVYIIHDYLLD
jgi:hypothetical protein